MKKVVEKMGRVG